MIKQRNRWLALLLSLCLMLLPLSAAWAEEEYDSLYRQASQEAVDAGHSVQRVFTAEIASLGEYFSPEEQDILQKIMENVRLEVHTFDDFDAVYHQYVLYIGGEAILTVDVRETEEEQQIRTNMLPGKILTSPIDEETATGLLIPISPFSLFTFYIPNVPGGTLSLSPEDAKTLNLLVDSYFFEIAGWVGKTQEAMDGTLYATEYPELPETETRDAVYSTFTANLSATDLKAAMRLMADTFYADEEMQRIVTNYLAGFDVTEEDVRKFADELPLHIRDLKDREGAVLSFTASYSENGDMVGFEGDLPQLFEQLPFAGANATYEAKHELDGLRGQGEAHVDLLEDGGQITADFSLWQGDLVDDTRSVSYGLDVAVTRGDGSASTTTAFYQMNQQRNGDTEQADYRASVLRSGNEPDQDQNLSLDLSGSEITTLLDDGHFTGLQEFSLLFAKDSTAEIRLRVETSTAPYTVPDFTSGEVIDLMTVSESKMAVLEEELMINGYRAALLSASLLPPEVLTAVRGLLSSLSNP